MNRIRELRKDKGMNQEELGEVVKVTKMTISRWESGKSDIDLDSLQTLSTFFGCSIDYILGKTNLPHPVTPQAQTILHEHHKVPVVGSVACSWNQGFIENFDGDYVYVNDVIYDRYGEQVRATVARGNSMKDMISPGDLLIVVPAVDIENDDVVIATISDDELTAKKFHYNDIGGFDLIPVNPDYGIQSFSERQVKNLPVKVVGRVIEIRKGLRA